MKERLKVSIIVLLYNSERFLKPLFDSIKKTKYHNYELIVVDNKSSDNSAKLAKELLKEFNNTKFIQSRKNLGYSGGNNLGIREAEGEIVILLNPDVIVEPDWIDKIIKNFDKKNVGIIGGMNILLEKKDNISKAEIKKEFPKPILAHMVSGSMMCVRKEVFEKVGLLNDLYFLYWEDSDFCFRAYSQGFDTKWCNDIIYYHYSGGSTGIREKQDKKKQEFVNYYYYRNEIIYYLINFSVFNVIRLLPLPFLRALFHLVKGNLTPLFSTIKGTIWIVKNFKIIIECRRGVQKRRERSDSEFFRRKRVKSDIAKKIMNSYT